MTNIKSAVLSSLAISLLAVATPTLSAAWDPPIGIPVPPFGITQVAPARPNPWTSEVAGFYYVRKGGTSSGNGFPGGSSSNWRGSIPNPVPAGATVFVDPAGGPLSGTLYGLRFNCTASAPCFITSYSAPTKFVITDSAWEVIGSYGIIEHVNFSNGAVLFATTDENYAVNSDRLALRHTEVSGNSTSTGGGTVVIGSHLAPTASGQPAKASNIVVWDVYVHDGGDANAQSDDDRGGIVVQGKTAYIWIVDNHVERVGRDGFTIVQQSGIGHPKDGAHHIFFGRNVSNNNRQGGFWTKEAQDVIFSQNVAYGHRPNSGGTGHGYGGQYEPERVWFLFNKAYDNERGIQSPGIKSAYAIGNVIYNTHHTIASYSPENLWDDQTGEAFYFRASSDVYLIGNTIHDVDAGIVTMSTGNLHILNNIIAGKTVAQARHIYGSNVTGTSEVRGNLLQGTSQISWNSSAIQSVSQFQSSNPSVASGNLNAEPVFVNASSRDFRLQSSSPAINAAAGTSVYETYRSLYGVDISKDFNGAIRPQGPAFDIGAFEFGASGGSSQPPQAPNNLVVN
jgi:hypothetical protein